jgi:hypothetical protein
MTDSGDNLVHHHQHRQSNQSNMNDKRKSNVSCNVSVLTADADFAATLYGLTNSGLTHHSHDHTSLNATNSNRSSLITNEHHSGKSNVYSISIQYVFIV